MRPCRKVARIAVPRSNSSRSRSRRAPARAPRAVASTWYWKAPRLPKPGPARRPPRRIRTLPRANRAARRCDSKRGVRAGSARSARDAELGSNTCARMPPIGRCGAAPPRRARGRTAGPAASAGDLFNSRRTPTGASPVSAPPAATVSPCPSGGTIVAGDPPAGSDGAGRRAASGAAGAVVRGRTDGAEAADLAALGGIRGAGTGTKAPRPGTNPIARSTVVAVALATSESDPSRNGSGAGRSGSELRTGRRVPARFDRAGCRGTQRSDKSIPWPFRWRRGGSWRASGRRSSS